MGKEGIGGALHRVRQRHPFSLSELHTENGSEFINHLLVPADLQRRIDATLRRLRSRAAHQQKNAGQVG
jgi:hypothetical protein